MRRGVANEFVPTRCFKALHPESGPRRRLDAGFRCPDGTGRLRRGGLQLHGWCDRNRVLPQCRFPVHDLSNKQSQAASPGKLEHQRGLHRDRKNIRLLGQERHQLPGGRLFRGRLRMGYLHRVRHRIENHPVHGGRRRQAVPHRRGFVARRPPGGRPPATESKEVGAPACRPAGISGRSRRPGPGSPCLGGRHRSAT